MVTSGTSSMVTSGTSSMVTSGTSSMVTSGMYTWKNVQHGNKWLQVVSSVQAPKQPAELGTVNV